MVAHHRQPVVRETRKQFAKRRFIFGEGREHIDMVVDQRGEQEMLRVIKGEFRAGITVADDVLIAFQHHIRRISPVPGGRQGWRNRADHPAGIQGGCPQDMGHKRRAGGFAERARHHGVYPTRSRFAHQRGKIGNPDPHGAGGGDFGIFLAAKLGAGAQHQ